MKEKIGKSLLQTLRPHPAVYEVADAELSGFYLRVQPSGKMNYYTRYRLPDGTRRRVRIGSAQHLTPAQARDEARKILADAIRGIDASRVIKKEKRRTLGSFITDDYAPTSLSNLKRGKETLLRLQSCFSDLWSEPLERISVGLLDKWRSKRIASGTKVSTVNRDIAALRSALTKAVDWDLLPTHPLKRLKQLKEAKDPIVRYLDEDEEGRLLNALEVREERIRAERRSANAWRRERGYREHPDLDSVAFADHLKPMVLLSLHTGLRRGELFALRWHDVDIGNEIITLRGSENKSGRTRHIPLNSTALQTLTAWNTRVEEIGHVFKGRDGAPFDNVSRSWSKVVQAATLKNFRWHDMRHHFASWLVMSGVDLNTVRELLGHSDLKMTLRYAHLAPEHTAAAVARLTERPGFPSNVVHFPSGDASSDRTSSPSLSRSR